MGAFDRVATSSHSIITMSFPDDGLCDETTIMPGHRRADTLASGAHRWIGVPRIVR